MAAVAPRLLHWHQHLPLTQTGQAPHRHQAPPRPPPCRHLLPSLPALQIRDHLMAFGVWALVVALAASAGAAAPAEGPSRARMANDRAINAANMGDVGALLVFPLVCLEGRVPQPV